MQKQKRQYERNSVGTKIKKKSFHIEIHIKQKIIFRNLFL
jgi:hypothetical protein